jgi:hypothetical protein
MRKVLIFLVFCLMSIASAVASVWVYPGADEALRSKIYEVTIIQNGAEYASFVYEHENQFTEKKSVMTDWNHFTNFSFSGEVTIRIKNLAGSVGICTVYPVADQVIPVVSGQEILLTISSPKKLFIEIEGMYEHPLFIFANPPEVDVPDRNDPTVTWFGPGIHNIGQQYPLQSGHTYYFEGGSYVYGSLHGSGISNVKITGRGVLSGREIAHHGYKDCNCFDGAAIHMYNGGNNQFLEGITISDPAMYAILSRGQITCRNVKCLGWWYETDGFGAGDNSTIEDCFFKVNDDVIKLYPANMVVRDLVIYQQINGAPFQFAWSGQSGSNGSVRDIDVVACEITASALWTSNKALINMRNGVGNNVTNFTFSNIRVDRNIGPIIGINTTGTCSGITLKDITIRGRQLYSSYIKGGTVTGISFENVTIGGQCVKQNADIGLQAQGSVAPVTYSCTTSAFEPDYDSDTFRVWPNPVTGQLNIFSDMSQPFSIHLFNYQGRITAEQHGIVNSTSIDMSSYKHGTYFIKLNAGNGYHKSITVLNISSQLQ